MLRKIIIASAALLAASVLNAQQALWGGGPVESPEMYSYIFNVDGLNVPDMNNIWVNRDIASMTSTFIVPGGRADLYTVRDVPHGTVSKVWYDREVAGFDRRMSIYTPPGYNPCGKTRYPVVYISPNSSHSCLNSACLL